MSIFLRIWFAFAIVLLVGSYFTLSTMQNQIKPSVRQVVEETLADNANIIACLIAPEVVTQKIETPDFQNKISQILNRKIDAKIWRQQKNNVSQQLYITDARGIVLYDSQGLATGQDYSRWNDVYLTLHGRYGVRSTRSDPNDSSTSTMYVAAPIIWNNQLVGVLTLVKPGVSVQPYIDLAQRDMAIRAAWIVALSLIVSAMLTWWLRHGIEQVRRYALRLTPQETSGQGDVAVSIVKQKPLRFWVARELNDLTQTIDLMREALAGKAYVETYVHTLTHELKSPLTAILASAELLQDDLPPADRLRFTQNIHEQTQRLQNLIERLLLLARLEKQQDRIEQKLEKKPIVISAIIAQLLQERSTIIEVRELSIQSNVVAGLIVHAEPFWFNQALGNILDNALDFTPHGGVITISCFALADEDQGNNKKVKENNIMIQIKNEGCAIPDYALPQVFDRYFSLPRPESGRKSTGIGLTLVREVMALHRGEVHVENVDGGVQVSLVF
jgi:two-component system sensor histidine kinase CreC